MRRNCEAICCLVRQSSIERQRQGAGRVLLEKNRMCRSMSSGSRFQLRRRCVRQVAEFCHQLRSEVSLNAEGSPGRLLGSITG